MKLYHTLGIQWCQTMSSKCKGLNQRSTFTSNFFSFQMLPYMNRLKLAFYQMNFCPSIYSCTLILSFFCHHTCTFAAGLIKNKFPYCVQSPSYTIWHDYKYIILSALDIVPTYTVDCSALLLLSKKKMLWWRLSALFKAHCYSLSGTYSVGLNNDNLYDWTIKIIRWVKGSCFSLSMLEVNHIL